MAKTQKYLLNLTRDVADEEDARLVAIVDEETKNKLLKCTFTISMFQVDTDDESFDEEFGEEAFTPITDEEEKVLKKFGLNDIRVGAFFFNTEDGDTIYGSDLSD